MKRIFWALNRDAKTVCVLTGFRHWEEVQGAARVGILMPCGNSANAIGRSKSMADFERRAAASGYTIVADPVNPETGQSFKITGAKAVLLAMTFPANCFQIRKQAGKPDKSSGVC